MVKLTVLVLTTLAIHYCNAKSYEVEESEELPVLKAQKLQRHQPSLPAASQRYYSTNHEPAHSQTQHVGVVKQVNLQDTKAGTYTSGFQAENGITQEVHEEHDGKQSVIKGSYSYHTPEGKTISVRYTADENGFRPEGDHINTPDSSSHGHIQQELIHHPRQPSPQKPKYQSSSPSQGYGDVSKPIIESLSEYAAVEIPQQSKYVYKQSEPIIGHNKPEEQPQKYNQPLVAQSLQYKKPQTFDEPKEEHQYYQEQPIEFEDENGEEAALVKLQEGSSGNILAEIEKYNNQQQDILKQLDQFNQKNQQQYYQPEALGSGGQSVAQFPLKNDQAIAQLQIAEGPHRYNLKTQQQRPKNRPKWNGPRPNHTRLPNQGPKTSNKYLPQRSHQPRYPQPQRPHQGLNVDAYNNYISKQQQSLEQTFKVRNNVPSSISLVDGFRSSSSAVGQQPISIDAYNKAQQGSFDKLKDGNQNIHFGTSVQYDFGGNQKRRQFSPEISSDSFGNSNGFKPIINTHTKQPKKLVDGKKKSS